METQHRDPHGTLDEPKGCAPNYLATGTILAVDDESSSLEALEDLLTMHGFRVFTAPEGRKAIDVFREQRPDLVITDIRMPHVDGLELLREVRRIDDAVPVIFVTGHGDLDNAVRALRRGAYDFLLKPINAEILLNTVCKGIEHFRLKRFEKDYRRLLEEQVQERTKELQERTKELAKTNEFLQGILDSSTRVAIVLTDFDHNIIFWNTGAENIFGYSPEEMVESSILRLYPEDARNVDTLAMLGRIMEGEAGTVQENIKQVAKDGRILAMSLAVSPMTDSAGRARGVLSLGQDVTEQIRLHDELLRSYQLIRKIQGASIFALAKLAESRDGETAFHLRRMQAYCRILCAALRGRDGYGEIMTESFVEDLIQCSVLHDIGKVAIPDAILFNPRKFGMDEFEIMKQHAIYGGRALEEAASEAGAGESYLTMGKDVAYYHHEHWDGSGYPFGLGGRDIPLAARIVAITDVYDALTTERRYKNAYSHDEACEIIVKEKGRKFDPDLVDVFLEVEVEFRRIRDAVSGQVSSRLPFVADAAAVAQPGTVSKL